MIHSKLSYEENSNEKEELTLTQEWDKIFPKSDKVDHEKVTFINRYGITLAADVYKPKGEKGPFAAITVAGPFGAVKEQSSGIYAQQLAERGFLTMAFDPSYQGESGGQPRGTVSLDINTEDFNASVDYLSNRDDVNHDSIGLVGICGFGGIGLNAASIDPRIKAACAATMYDMQRVYANGYFDVDDSKEARNAAREMFAKIRTEDYKNGTFKMTEHNPDELSDDMSQIAKDYYDFYKTPRGYHERSLGSKKGWPLANLMSMANVPLMNYLDENDCAVLIVHGEKAHSRYMGLTAYNKLTEASNGDYQSHNKNIIIVPGANHVDLYDKVDIIPFDSIEKFFKEYLIVKK